MTADPLRLAAWEILRDVERGAPLDSRLDRAQDRLPPDRRAFLAELVKGTLVLQGRYDRLIRRFSRDGHLPKVRARVLLRLGLHQLLHCDSVPAYAAVNESVQLSKRVLGRGQSGFINALLGSIAREIRDPDRGLDALMVHFPDPIAEPAAFIAAWHSHPLWLVERWLKRFGVDQTVALCRFNNTPARATFHVRRPHDPLALQQALAVAGIETRVSPLTERALVSVNTLPRSVMTGMLQERHEVIVQDASVQAATSWLLDAARGSLLDLCAAPGGKTVLAGDRRGTLQSVTAMDLRPNRLRKIADTLRRTGLEDIALIAGDGRCPPFRSESFDTLLLDGPCSGTGVIRHHPEGRWRLKPETLGTNALRLGELARNALSLLAAGGSLLYSTCSLEPEENLDVLDALVRGTPGVDYAFEGSAEASTRSWLPQVHGADGFFAAILSKESAQ